MASVSEVIESLRIIEEKLGDIAVCIQMGENIHTIRKCMVPEDITISDEDGARVLLCLLDAKMQPIERGKNE